MGFVFICVTLCVISCLLTEKGKAVKSFALKEAYCLLRLLLADSAFEIIAE